MSHVSFGQRKSSTEEDGFTNTNLLSSTLQKEEETERKYNLPTRLRSIHEIR